MGTGKVVSLGEARERRVEGWRREGLCPRCGAGGAHVWAHLVHCSDWSTEEKEEAMTGRYGLTAELAGETVTAWERSKVYEIRGGTTTTQP